MNDESCNGRLSIYLRDIHWLFGGEGGNGYVEKCNQAASYSESQLSLPYVQAIFSQ